MTKIRNGWKRGQFWNVKKKEKMDINNINAMKKEEEQNIKYIEEYDHEKAFGWYLRRQVKNEYFTEYFQVTECQKEKKVIKTKEIWEI